MTVREMIAQLIWVPAWAGEPGDNFRQVEELVVKYGIGGVIFFEGNTCSTGRFYRSVSMQSPRIPLIIAQDAEWGTGMRLGGCGRFSLPDDPRGPSG